MKQTRFKYIRPGAHFVHCNNVFVKIQNRLRCLVGDHIPIKNNDVLHNCVNLKDGSLSYLREGSRITQLELNLKMVDSDGNEVMSMPLKKIIK